MASMAFVAWLTLYACGGGSAAWSEAVGGALLADEDEAVDMDGWGGYADAVVVSDESRVSG